MRIVGGLEDQEKKAQVALKLANLAEEIVNMPSAPRGVIIHMTNPDGSWRRIEYITDGFNALEAIGCMQMTIAELLGLIFKNAHQAPPAAPHQPPENPA